MNFDLEATRIIDIFYLRLEGIRLTSKTIFTCDFDQEELSYLDPYPHAFFGIYLSDSGIESTDYNGRISRL